MHLEQEFLLLPNPPTTELLIGIQQKGFQYLGAHRQRNAIDIAAARINVTSVVGLLNAIGDQWSITGM